MNNQSDYLPFKLFGAPQEGNLRATLIENYARAVAERMLPALTLSAEEEKRLFEEDWKRHEQAQRERPFLDDYRLTGEFGDFSNVETPVFEALNYARLEMNQIWYHALSFSFAELFHLFERQRINVLSILNYRRRGNVWPNNQRPEKIEFDDEN